MNCSNCRFANKSGNKDFVYCTYWQDRCNESGKPVEDFIKNVLFKETLVDKVATGWGYPKQHFSLESDWVHKGTLTEGLMWNEQICIGMSESCNNFKKV